MKTEMKFYYEILCNNRPAHLLTFGTIEEASEAAVKMILDDYKSPFHKVGKYTIIRVTRTETFREDGVFVKGSIEKELIKEVQA